jgi:acyl carrier protein
MQIEKDRLALEQEIKSLLIASLNLEDLGPEQIDAEQALFVDGLGLDSIDALELGLALQQRYGVSMTADSEQTRQHFASIRALAQFVALQRSK